MINLDLQPEYIAKVAGFSVSNTLLTSVLVSVLVLGGVAFFDWRQKSVAPGFLGQGLRILIFELLKLTDSVTGNRFLSKKLLPLTATFFIFIGAANLLALLPGFLGSLFVSGTRRLPILRSPDSDLNTTLALAIVSVFATQIFSVQNLGPKAYLARFFNFKSPIKFILGFFEMIAEGVRLISFSFRLFGNIFAGEVLLLIAAFLAPFLIPVPFMVLEVFVGFVQAFIFAMLTLTFMKTSSAAA